MSDQELPPDWMWPDQLPGEIAKPKSRKHHFAKEGGGGLSIFCALGDAIDLEMPERDVRITITAIQGARVRVCISAPDDVTIVRQKIKDVEKEE